MLLYNGKSLMYWENSMGPKMEPCGTTCISVDREDVWVPTLTHCCLLLR